MAPRILVIEDEVKIARILSIELTHEGYEVETAADGRKGLEKALGETWDVILLDIMLPELNGIEVLRRIRANNRTTPVIVLTARDETPDIVSALDFGANDYITKPFEVEELLARIRAGIRVGRQLQEQSDPGQSAVLTAGTLELNTKTWEVTRDNRKIELTPKEYDLLVYLLQNKNEVLSREQIVQNVWNYDFVGDTNTVDVYIRYLRQKIDKGFKPQLIQTVRGIGYCLREPDS